MQNSEKISLGIKNLDSNQSTKPCDLCTIWCPNGKIKFERSLLKTSSYPYICGSMIEKQFVGEFAQANILRLNYDISIIKLLIPYIRDGIIHVTFDNTLRTPNFEYELRSMINYLALDNEFLQDAAKQLKDGCMDAAGRHYKNVMCIKFDEYPFTQSYNYKEHTNRQDILNQEYGRKGQILYDRGDLSSYTVFEPPNLRFEPRNAQRGCYETITYDEVIKLLKEKLKFSVY